MIYKPMNVISPKECGEGIWLGWWFLRVIFSRSMKVMTVMSPYVCAYKGLSVLCIGLTSSITDILWFLMVAWAFSLKGLLLHWPSYYTYNCDCRVSLEKCVGYSCNIIQLFLYIKVVRGCPHLDALIQRKWSCRTGSHCQMTAAAKLSPSHL